MKKSLSLRFSIVSTALLASLPLGASGSVLPITSVVTSPVLSTETTVTAPVELLGLSSGGVDYTSLSFTTVTSSSSGVAFYSRQEYLDNGNTAPDASEKNSLLSDAYLNHGAVNVTNVKLQFGQSYDAADATVFFMFDFTTNTAGDDVRVYALDSGGTRITDDTSTAWFLEITASDYGSRVGDFDTSYGVSSESAVGLTFLLSDFTGVGALNGVAGFEFSDSDDATHRWDPVGFGVASVPEVDSFASIVGVFCLVGIIGRRFLKRRE